MTRDTPAITEAAYRHAAQLEAENGSPVEVPEDGVVSRSMGGAYVAAWIWVPAEAAIAVMTDQKEAA